MALTGSFGYKIGRKIRLMHIQCNADLLWQICVREIYVLMNHFKTIDAFKQAFENIKETKGKPKPEAIEKCKYYRDLSDKNEMTKDDWHNLMRFCQHSFINILDSGFFLNNGEKNGMILLLDFNTNSVRHYSIYNNEKESEFECATIEEIMKFDDMPTKSYTEIIKHTKDRFNEYDKKMNLVDEEIKKIKSIIQKANEMGGEQNIIKKARELLDDMEWERKKLELEYKYFYHRLDDLNLIDHEDTNSKS
jgi:hypothetical protein